MTRRLATFLFFLTVVFAQPHPDIGEINGARFRIDVPEQWNGVLIMYCHGYSVTPGTFEAKRLHPVLATLVAEGYAVAQSGYAAGGWAIEEAIQDTEALRRYFIAKRGSPKETYVTGHSMGGFLTAAMVEKFPNAYDGGLALCGPLAPAAWFLEHRVFDLRVVFDYYFPGRLPSPAKVPRDFTTGPEKNAAIEKALESDPGKAQTLRRFSGIRTNRELASTLVFFTYILKDLQERCGGNPFDNHNTIYEGVEDEDALNDGVARYSADPGATTYLAVYCGVTGHVSRPLLAIHNTYDPLVPAGINNVYSSLTETAGTAGLFVQQYVKRPGHCAIEPGDVLRGLSQLREWRDTGRRPPAGEAR